jgi:long-chain acyl-CoA synthetase
MNHDPIFALGPHRPAQPVVGDAQNFGQVILHRRRATPDTAACFEKREGAWQRHSWDALVGQAEALAAGLVERGLERGETVAILGATQPGWLRADLAGHLAGLVTVGIYPKQAPEQVRYILEHGAVRVAFVGDGEEMEILLEAAQDNAILEAIVPWDAALAERFAGRDPRIVPPAVFGVVVTADQRATLEERLGQVQPDDTAILVYTSGTTGPPKGARISHGNILALLRHQNDVLRFYQDDLVLSFLPMAHVTERILGFYVRINTGTASAYASSIGAVLAELQEVRPTIFGAVPRIFEKAHAKIRGEVAAKPALVQRLFAWAEKVGRKTVWYRLEEKPLPLLLAAQYALADRLALHKIRAAFGGRVRLCITGAAPLAEDILRLFWAVGFRLYEGYGMTEATVITHLNRPGATRLGTVGRVLPFLEHRIASDGEILLHGPIVFQGYLKNPEATAETLVDGWLHTGDIGTIDDDGYLRITDRKKHLIITAGGKNVAPANIEQAIKSQSPLISQVHAHGDRRQFISALIAPSPIETLQWGAQNGHLAADEAQALIRALMANPTARTPELQDAMARVTTRPEFQQLFVEPVRRGNEQLARVEKVRRFVVLDRDLSQEEGELTPTMKVKRKVLETKFRDLFDRMYGEEGFGLEAEGPR